MKDMFTTFYVPAYQWQNIEKTFRDNLEEAIAAGKDQVRQKDNNDIIVVVNVKAAYKAVPKNIEIKEVI